MLISPALIWILLYGGVQVAESTLEDQNFILEGVNTVFQASVPGAAVVFGDNSFPICAGQEYGLYKPFSSGVRYGQGKVILVGHTNFVVGLEDVSDYDNHRLFENYLRWVGGGAPRTGGMHIYEGEVPMVTEKLTLLGASSSLLQTDLLSNLTYLREHDILIINELNRERPDFPVIASAINSYVSLGGGLILGSTPWSYYPSPGVPYRDSFWANPILRDMGALFVPAYLYPPAPHVYNASLSFLQDVHLNDVWQSIKEIIGNENENVSFRRVELLFMAMLDRVTFPEPDFGFATEIYWEFIGLPTFTPTDNTPVTEENEKAFLLAYEYFAEMINIVHLSFNIPPHPSAEFFPGSTPSFELPSSESLSSNMLEINLNIPNWAKDLRTRQINKFLPSSHSVCNTSIVEKSSDVDDLIGIDASTKGWHSTGLYAPAGSIIWMEIVNNSEIDTSQMEMHIGVHTDNIKGLDRWDRFHRIVYWNNFVGQRAELVSPFGGLIFLDVPQQFSNQSFNISITGGVLSPTFVLGKTNLQSWRNEIRHYPAPWGELIGENIILSVRKTNLETLDDPEEVILLWDQILDAIADLAAIPRQRMRPERIVADVQISAGSLHSGYPIMSFLSDEHKVVNFTKIKFDSSELWGHFHELGHNHQKSDWTFSGTGEVTCNLFALYVMHTVCGRETNVSHPNLSDDNMSQLVREYIEGGTQFSQWQSDPWLALLMYIQLQETFGWTAYRHVFANYFQLSDDEHPSTDQEKIDLWMIMFSNENQENLTPFFRSWGLPITTEAENRVSHLPETELRIRNP